jgi:hypothetical protein
MAITRAPTCRAHRQNPHRPIACIRGCACSFLHVGASRTGLARPRVLPPALHYFNARLALTANAALREKQSQPENCGQCSRPIPRIPVASRPGPLTGGHNRDGNGRKISACSNNRAPPSQLTNIPDHGPALGRSQWTTACEHSSALRKADGIAFSFIRAGKVDS